MQATTVKCRITAKHPPLCYRPMVAGRVSIVAFDGRSVFEGAVRNAMRFFADDYWRGPKSDLR
jgi:hypothetical protein